MSFFIIQFSPSCFFISNSHTYSFSANDNCCLLMVRAPQMFSYFILILWFGLRCFFRTDAFNCFNKFFILCQVCMVACLPMVYQKIISWIIIFVSKYITYYVNLWIDHLKKFHVNLSAFKLRFLTYEKWNQSNTQIHFRV